MSKAIAKLVAHAADLYERFKLYKANPCDVDACAPLKRAGRVLAALTTHCPCCTGARIAAAFILGATLSWRWSVGIGVLILLSAVVKSTASAEDQDHA